MFEELKLFGVNIFKFFLVFLGGSLSYLVVLGCFSVSFGF